MEHPNITTSAEASMLEKHRKPLVPSLELTPGGSLQYQTDYDVERMRERRISFIRNRLSMASHKVHRDHDQAISQEQ